MSDRLEKKHLIWIDLEMTGLDPEIDRILELAMVITNQDLDVIAEFGPAVIYQPQNLFEKMSEWCQKTHQKTGLWARVQSATTTEKDIEDEALGFLRSWVPAGISPACGSTVFHDRRFLARYMPRLQAYFHYRCIDVSSIKELVQRWRPELLKEWKKPHPHQALLDIHASVDELKFYRERFFQMLSCQTTSARPIDNSTS